MGAKDHHGVANLDPSAMADMIYVRDHLTLLNTKIYKLWASWFKRRFFLFFSNYKSMQTLGTQEWGQFGPRSGASLDPRSLIGGIYVRDH